MNKMWLLQMGPANDDYANTLFLHCENAKKYAYQRVFEILGYDECKSDPEFEGWLWNEEKQQYSAKVKSMGGYYICIKRLTVIDLLPEIA